jgi:hypothetical protein
MIVNIQSLYKTAVLNSYYIQKGYYLFILEWER